MLNSDPGCLCLDFSLGEKKKRLCHCSWIFCYLSPDVVIRNPLQKLKAKDLTLLSSPISVRTKSTVSFNSEQLRLDPAYVPEKNIKV